MVEEKFIDKLPNRTREKINLYLIYNILAETHVNRMCTLIILIGLFGAVTIALPLFVIDSITGFFTLALIFMVDYGFVMYWLYKHNKITNQRKFHIFGNIDFDQFLEELDI
jgi:hypothetical protein